MKLGKIDWIILIFAIILIISGIYLFVSPNSQLLNCIYDIYSIDEYSKLGEYLGGVVGSLWALAGVFLFFLALRLQANEIKNQINELVETRKVFEHQKFENTFFNMIKTQQDITKDIFFNDQFKNRRFFTFMRQELEKIYDAFCYYKYINNFDPNNGYEANDSDTVHINKNYSIDEIRYNTFNKFNDEDLKIFEIYNCFDSKYHIYFNHYFRHLEQILLLLDRSHNFDLLSYKKDKDKIDSKYKNYSSIIKSQLSTAELCCFFYYAIFRNQEDVDIIKIIDRYELLEDLQESLLIKHNHCIFVKKLKKVHYPVN